MLRGAITATLGGRNKDMFVPTSDVVSLQGAMGENRTAGDPQFDALMSDAEIRGFVDDQDGNRIVIGVNHKGEAYVIEGNTRAAVAQKLGIPYVKAEVRYWLGGEEKQGAFSPDRVAAKAVTRPATASEIIKEETNSSLFDPIDTNEYDDTTYYHGTSKMFEEFDATKMGTATRAASAQQAFWFTDSPETAGTYADHSANDVAVRNLLEEAQQLELQARAAANAHIRKTGEIVDFMDVPEARRSMELSEAKTREAEELEQEIFNNPERGQNIIPVRLPDNLLMRLMQRR